MHRVVVIACLAAITALVLAMARPPETQEATFTFNNGLEVHSLDPHRISWKHDIRIAWALFEGLMAFRVDPPPEGQEVGQIHVVPAVAQRYEVSADGKTYTFHLRPEVSWSNGQRVTAGQFVWSWKRVMTPITGADYAGMMNVIRGARQYYDDLAAGRAASFEQVGLRAPDDSTLVVELEHPTGYFLELTAFPPFLPVYPPLLQAAERPGVAEQNGIGVYDESWTNVGTLVGNGPFVLARHDFKDQMVLEKSPTYWDRDNVKLQRVRALAIEDLNASMYAYESHRVDLIDAVPGGAVRAMLRQEESQRRTDVYGVTSFGTYFYRFNCQETARGRKNPFADPRVRRAFAMAVDKADIVDNVTGQRQPVAGALIPPGLTVSDSQGKLHEYHGPAGLPYDPEAARKLLAEAGYPNGEGLGEIHLMFNNGYGHQPIAERLVTTWQRELGVNVILDQRDGSAFSQELKQKENRQWHLARSAWFGDYRDPTTFLEMFLTSDGNNDCRYANPEFDALLAQAAQTADAEKRLEILGRAEDLVVVKDAAVVPLYYYVEHYMIRPNVKDAWPNLMGSIMLKQIYLEPQER